MREDSRRHWTSNSSAVDINCGSLQRIADAVEKMAASYDDLREDRDRYREWNDANNKRLAALNRKVAAQKGVITKLKKKLNPPANQ
jgi:hypothetical protein